MKNKERKERIISHNRSTDRHRCWKIMHVSQTLTKTSSDWVKIFPVHMLMMCSDVLQDQRDDNRLIKTWFTQLVHYNVHWTGVLVWESCFFIKFQSSITFDISNPTNGGRWLVWIACSYGFIVTSHPFRAAFHRLQNITGIMAIVHMITKMMLKIKR